jgi:hypothetical protein
VVFGTRGAEVHLPKILDPLPAAHDRRQPAMPAPRVTGVGMARLRSSHVGPPAPAAEDEPTGREPSRRAGVRRVRGDRRAVGAPGRADSSACVTGIALAAIERVPAPRPIPAIMRLPPPLPAVQAITVSSS